MWRLLCLGSLVSVSYGAVTSGSVNYASGFTTTHAWSSLTDFVPENIQQSFTAWEDEGVIKFNLILQVFGHFGQPGTNDLGLEENGTVAISSLISEDLHWSVQFDPAIHLSWTVGGRGGWYTDVWMQSGGIVGQDPHFLIAEEEMGWIAGVYIHGVMTPQSIQYRELPEPATLAMFLVLGLVLPRQRRGFL